MARLPRRTAALLFLQLLAATPLAASEFSDDLAARRARLMEQLGPDTIVVLLSAPARTYSGDVTYEYRQDSNLYYLTGITQEDTMLVLMPGNTTRRELLFVRDRNPEREHWTGHLLTRDEARERSGIATVLSTSGFDAFLGDMLSRRGTSTVPEKEAAAFFSALAEGRARVAVPVQQASVDDPLPPVQQLLRRLRDQYVGFVAIDAAPAINRLRMVKTPYELRMLTTAAEISAEA